MMAHFVVTDQAVNLVGREVSDLAPAGGSEIPTSLAMALQQQSAVGRGQAPAQIVRFFNAKVFHLVGGLEDRLVRERRHETKTPGVPIPQFVSQRDTVASPFGKDAGLEGFSPMIMEKPERLVASADRLEPKSA